MSNETESILDLQIEVIQASIYCDIIKRLLLQHRSVSIVKVIVFSFIIKKQQYCQQLKLKSPKDGKRYKTDVADTERLLRIIQSIPSPKAEPFKRWLAEVGRERIEETIDPELTIDRALETYLKKDTPANGLTNACRRSKSAKS